MWQVAISNLEPLAVEPDVLPTALRGPAVTAKSLNIETEMSKQTVFLQTSVLLLTKC